MTMTKQCLLSFQIWSLQEQVLCDAVEMDACHILLGRQWLFDRKVHHGGRENTYEFKKDGQWYKLAPKLENVVETTADYRGISMNNSSVMLCLGKELLKEEKKA